MNVLLQPALPPVRPVRPYASLAPAYDALLGFSSLARTCRAFERLVRLHDIRFRSAVDIGCGTGLFARYLRRCWRAAVFGVDRSHAMLCEAVRRLRGDDVVLLRQDVRCLRLPQPVDLATANFDTLNHLIEPGDLLRVFRRIAANLTTHGWLIFDAITPCRPADAPPLVTIRRRCGGRRVTQCIRWLPGSTRLRIRLVIRDPVVRALLVEEHEERAFAPSEIARSLSRAGFVVRGVHDATTLRPARGCPSRILVIARRSG